MNKLFILIIGFLLSINFISAKEFHLDSQVPKPDSIKFFQNPEEKTLAFARLLKEGKIGEFYVNIEKELTKIGSIPVDDLTSEDFKHQVWIYYFVTASPLFDEETITSERTDNNGYSVFSYDKEDLISKDVARFAIPRFTNAKMAKKYAFSEYNFSALMAAYYAKILKTFYDFYNPERYRKIGHDRTNAYHCKNEAEFQSYQSKLTLEFSRQSYAGTTWNFDQEDFINSLIKSFPSKASEIKKYLIQAGHKEENLIDLLDATMGRTSKTEFLYKSLKMVKSKKNKRSIDGFMPGDII